MTNTSPSPQPSLKTCCLSFHLLCHLSFSLTCPTPNIHPPLCPFCFPLTFDNWHPNNTYSVFLNILLQNHLHEYTEASWEDFLVLEHGCRDLLPFSHTSICKGFSSELVLRLTNTFNKVKVNVKFLLSHVFLKYDCRVHVKISFYWPEILNIYIYMAFCIMYFILFLYEAYFSPHPSCIFILSSLYLCFLLLSLSCFLFLWDRTTFLFFWKQTLSVRLTKNTSFSLLAQRFQFRLFPSSFPRVRSLSFWSMSHNYFLSLIPPSARCPGFILPIITLWVFFSVPSYVFIFCQSLMANSDDWSRSLRINVLFFVLPSAPSLSPLTLQWEKTLLLFNISSSSLYLVGHTSTLLLLRWPSSIFTLQFPHLCCHHRPSHHFSNIYFYSASFSLWSAYIMSWWIIEGICGS